MRTLVFLVAITALATPASAQSDKTSCKQMLDAVSQLSTTYRGVLDTLNDLPVNNVVANLKGEERELAKKMAEAHQAVRPVLTTYVQSLEDLTYALQVCRR